MLTVYDLYINARTYNNQEFESRTFSATYNGIVKIGDTIKVEVFNGKTRFYVNGKNVNLKISGSIRVVPLEKSFDIEEAYKGGY